MTASIKGLEKLKKNYSDKPNVQKKMQSCIERFNETIAILDKAKEHNVQLLFSVKNKGIEKMRFIENYTEDLQIEPEKETAIPPLPEEERAAFIKRFALLFGDTFIKDTGLEGGEKKYSIKYWLNMVESWEKGDVLNPPQLQKNVIRDLKADFKERGVRRQVAY